MKVTSISNQALDVARAFSALVGSSLGKPSLPLPSAWPDPPLYSQIYATVDEMPSRRTEQRAERVAGCGEGPPIPSSAPDRVPAARSRRRSAAII